MRLKRKIRVAYEGDLDGIMRVVEAAKRIMRDSGNTRQWIDGYPSRDVIMLDINSSAGHVVTEDERIVAYFAFLPSPEPTYASIDGQWLDDVTPYHVIHRLASFPDVHGIFAAVIDYCSAIDPNLRVDTHSDNAIMRRLILRHGFNYCGVITLANGHPRLAFQRLHHLGSEQSPHDQ